MTNASPSAAEALEMASNILSNCGIENYRREARVILQSAAKLSVNEILNCPEKKLTKSAWNTAKSWVYRRANNEPLSYITNYKEFWSLNFKVSRSTLIPRPDSEIVVEAALANIQNKSDILKILDLGTGSGCLLSALLSELPNASGVGVDVCIETCKIAQDNIESLGFSNRAHIITGNWCESIADKFDIIVCNPPYIAWSNLADLDAEIINFEPSQALDGGIDGLDAYRVLGNQFAGVLKSRSKVFIEIGYGQSEKIAEILTKCGMEILDICYDLANIQRCIIATIKN